MPSTQPTGNIQYNQKESMLKHQGQTLSHYLLLYIIQWLLATSLISDDGQSKISLHFYLLSRRKHIKYSPHSMQKHPIMYYRTITRCIRREGVMGWIFIYAQGSFFSKHTCMYKISNFEYYCMHCTQKLNAHIQWSIINHSLLWQQSILLCSRTSITTRQQQQQ